MAVGLQMGNERSRSEHRHEKSMKRKTSKSFGIDVSTTTCDDQVEDSQVERRRVAVSAWPVPVRALEITLEYGLEYPLFYVTLAIFGLCPRPIGYRIQDTGYRIQNTEYRTYNT